MLTCSSCHWIDFTVPQCKGYTENIKGGFVPSASVAYSIANLDHTSAVDTFIVVSQDKCYIQTYTDASMTFWWTDVSSRRTKSRDSWACDKDDSRAWPWCISGVLRMCRHGMGMPWVTVGQLSASPVVGGNPSLGTTAVCHKAAELWRSQKSHLAKDWLYPWVPRGCQSLTLNESGLLFVFVQQLLDTCPWRLLVDKWNTGELVGLAVQMRSVTLAGNFQRLKDHLEA